MNNNKQSSIEWYDNEIGKLFNQFTVDKITIYEFRTEQLKLKQQAKAMHNEEIEEAELKGKEIIIIKHTEHGGGNNEH
jgi:hypothetical protein